MNIEAADRLAEELHAGQLDKAGKPYIDHPRAVAEMLRRNKAGDEALVVALLHDVVEDCDVELGDLAARGVPEVCVEAIDAISRRDGEKYAAYIERVAANPIAKGVKVADLLHNLSPERQAGLNPSLEKRYNRSLARLVDGWDVL